MEYKQKTGKMIHEHEWGTVNAKQKQWSKPHKCQSLTFIFLAQKSSRRKIHPILPQNAPKSYNSDYKIDDQMKLPAWNNIPDLLSYASPEWWPTPTVSYVGPEEPL